MSSLYCINKLDPVVLLSFSHHSVLWMDHLFNLLQLPQHRPHPHPHHQQTLQGWLHSHWCVRQELHHTLMNNEAERCQSFQFKALTLNISWWAGSLSDYLHLLQPTPDLHKSQFIMPLEAWIQVWRWCYFLSKWLASSKNTSVSLLKSRICHVICSVFSPEYYCTLKLKEKPERVIMMLNLWCVCIEHLIRELTFIAEYVDRNLQLWANRKCKKDYQGSIRT